MGFSFTSPSREAGPSCLTVNRLPQFVRQVTNEQRQNRPSVKVSPVDDNGDVELSKIIQGFVRHIEVKSGAPVAYDTAFTSAARCGFGYFRIITKYSHSKSFNQEICYQSIKDPFWVYVDPYYREPDGSDMNWAFVTKDMSREDYESLYGKSKLSGIREWEGLGDSLKGWVSKDSCRVSEYFYKEEVEVDILLLSSGEVLEKTEALSLGDLEVISERKTKVQRIHWCLLNGLEVLSRTTWPGQWIPIIPVLGEELDIDGTRRLESVIRHAKDSQQAYNYWVSCETEAIALAPKAPWVGAEGQFEGHEEEWSTANRVPHAYLEYKPTSYNGQLVGPPQRNVFEPPVQAITNARIHSNEDLKGTTGIYDAFLGNQGQEYSGVAIQRRVNQAQTSQYHLVDNLNRSIRHGARIVVDLIPKIYDTAQSIRILGENEEEKIVRINEVFEEDGQEKSFYLTRGQYDVTLSTGPSFSTKRQEAVESILSLVQSYPAAAQVASDILLKNMDWPGSEEIAERLKKLVPPEVLENKDMEIPPEVQSKLEEMSQVIEDLSSQLNEAKELVRTKTLELESKERIEASKLDVDLKKSLAKLDVENGMEFLREELEKIQERLNELGPLAPLEQSEDERGRSMEMLPNEPTLRGRIEPESE